MHVRIADIITIMRSAKLPSHCPHCDKPVDAARLIQRECTAQSVDIERSGGRGC